MIFVSALFIFTSVGCFIASLVTSDPDRQRDLIVFGALFLLLGHVVDIRHNLNELTNVVKGLQP